LRFVRVAIALALALLSLLVSTGAPANAADGSVSGRVTDQAGNPIQGAGLNAQPMTGGGDGSAITDANGDYTIGGLAPGNYRVAAAAAGFVFELYDDTIDFALATAIAVTSGADRPNTDFELSTGGGISGLVTDEIGSPLQGVFVEASFVDGCCSNGGATTGPDGVYTILGLAPGSYRVFAFTSPTSLSGEFYDNTSDLTAATPVTVAEGAVTPSIDFALSMGGSISGRVEDEAGNPIAGASVDALLFEGCCAFALATTSADGTYTIEGLPAGSYRLFASVTGFASEYYDNTVDASLASPIAVTDGADTSGIDFALSACGSALPITAGDDDCDGFSTVVEEFVGTNPMMACADGLNPSDWPPDFNDDQTVTVIDLVPGFKQAFGATDASDPRYDPRYDLNLNGAINISDLVPGFKLSFGLTCAP
jgi:uncharacterized surface anchored protein